MKKQKKKIPRAVILIAITGVTLSGTAAWYSRNSEIARIYTEFEKHEYLGSIQTIYNMQYHKTLKERGGRVWELVAMPTQEYFTVRQTSEAQLTFLIGLLLTTLFAAYIYSESNKRAEIEQLVLERTAELLSARDAAEAANRAKIAFLRTVSHEMRTPLTSIKAILDPAALKMMTAEENPVFLAMAYTETRRLTSLVEDILDMAKIESGKMEIAPESVHALTVVEESIQSVKLVAEEKNIAIDVIGVADSIIVYGEQKRLRQIFINLFGNAIEFTPEKGKITVTAGTNGDYAIFAVKDTGCGIPEKKRELIFKAFEQVDDSPTREHGGTGLGLAITKGLVEMHGGHITVESKINEGAVFTFSIPIFKE